VLTIFLDAVNYNATVSVVPVCGVCNTRIRGPFVCALDQCFCPHHFLCQNPSCQSPLHEKGFVLEEGKLYCENCYAHYFAPKCAACGQVIMETSLQAMNSVWHPNCFLCTHCRKPIGITIGFHVENGLPYCPEDYAELFSTKCDACSKAIQAGDRWIEACKKPFHAECFNCSRCGMNLDGKPVVQHEGKASCKAHGGSFGRFGGISRFWYTNISSI